MVKECSQYTNFNERLNCALDNLQERENTRNEGPVVESDTFDPDNEVRIPVTVKTFNGIPLEPPSVTIARAREIYEDTYAPKEAAQNDIAFIVARELPKPSEWPQKNPVKPSVPKWAERYFEKPSTYRSSKPATPLKPLSPPKPSPSAPVKPNPIISGGAPLLEASGIFAFALTPQSWNVELNPISPKIEEDEITIYVPVRKKDPNSPTEYEEAGTIKRNPEEWAPSRTAGADEQRGEPLKVVNESAPAPAPKSEAESEKKSSEGDPPSTEDDFPKPVSPDTVAKAENFALSRPGWTENDLRQRGKTREDEKQRVPDLVLVTKAKDRRPLEELAGRKLPDGTPTEAAKNLQKLLQIFGDPKDVAPKVAWLWLRALANKAKENGRTDIFDAIVKKTLSLYAMAHNNGKVLTGAVIETVATTDVVVLSWIRHEGSFEAKASGSRAELKLLESMLASGSPVIKVRVIPRSGNGHYRTPDFDVTYKTAYGTYRELWDVKSNIGEHRPIDIEQFTKGAYDKRNYDQYRVIMVGGNTPHTRTIPLPNDHSIIVNHIPDLNPDTDNVMAKLLAQ